MQYINNEKREELKKEFIKGFSEEGFYLVTDREYGVFATYWLNKAEELVAERVQAIREELEAWSPTHYKGFGVSPLHMTLDDHKRNFVKELLSLPSLTPKK